ncbi:MAG: acyl-CoA thioesterase [Betaproteobacteria bacterium]|nr:acyl-CoA thioesterase [Betaproteobacteria bacterium]
MSAPFVYPRKIRFSHCDPAGILYFPHVFDFLNAAVEDWFETELGMPFGEFHMRHRMGNPVVTTDGRFRRAFRFGEQIALELHVTRIGRSSIDMTVLVKAGGEERMRLRHRTVMVSLDRFRSVAIPDALRARAEKFIAPEPPLPQGSAWTQLQLPGAAPACAFRSPQRVRYFHCDPGGIVYFARFFDLFNVALEDWFAEPLACPWGPELMGARKLSIPSVAVRVEFLHACRLGEMLELDLWVTRIGRSSIELAIACRGGGEDRLRAAWCVCMVSRENFRAAPVPEDLRLRMLPYLVSGAQAAERG